MITHDPQEFLQSIQKNQVLLGLDLGTKTIGTALSDRLWLVGSAYNVVRRKKFTEDARNLLTIIIEHQITGIILGWPINMDGSQGPRTQSTMSFAKNFEKFQRDESGKSLPILLWDERLSTVEAERAMIEADMSRKKRSEKIDSVAASLILRGALERFSHLNP